MGAMACVASDVLEENLSETVVSAVLPALQDTVKTDTEDNTVYKLTDTPAEYPGGEEAINAFINKTMRYPLKAIEEGIQGKVVLKFIINKDGSLSDIKVEKSVHKLLDDEAIRLAKAMSKWEPARQKGKIVRSYFSFPLRFQLASSEENK